MPASGHVWAHHSDVLELHLVADLLLGSHDPALCGLVPQLAAGRGWQADPPLPRLPQCGFCHGYESITRRAA